MDSLFVYSYDHIDFSNVHTKSDIIDLLEKHDPNSFRYCVNTGLLNVSIAKELGYSSNDLYLFFQCGIFHDTGKLGMSSEFINFPGAFPLKMYQEMKKHTIGGYEILHKINAEEEICNTARYHHCNFDGSGYPGGLFEDEIPIYARITRVSDSIDAYLSKRCYKDGGPTNLIVDDLLQYRGKSYDPIILDAFARVHDNVMEVCYNNNKPDPSQDYYMSILEELYGSEQKEMFYQKELGV